MKDHAMVRQLSACETMGSATIIWLGLVGMHTARAIAFECGILDSDDNLHNEAFDKLLMVQSLKQKGHVIAVTGDGINDAPTLKETDIRLSMGI